MNKAGIWVGLVLLVSSGIFFVQSLSYQYYSETGPGSGFFPLWLSGILAFLSVLYIIDTVRKEDIKLSTLIPKGPGLRKVLSVFGSLILFLIIAPYTGYLFAGVVMLFILFFREVKWYWGLGISLVVTFILFFTFGTLLSIPLPVNSFGL